MENIYKSFGIYRITNILSGKSYIGKTAVNFGDRWDCHRAQLKGGYHDNPHLQHAWDKYGQESFEFAIVEQVLDTNLLDDLEKRYIKLYREQGLSYNILDGGDGGFLLGSHLTEETKRKIGEKNRANMLGKKLSDETRKRMSDSQQQRYAAWTDKDRVEHGRRSSECASGYKWSKDARVRFSKRQQTQPNGATLTVDDVRTIRHLYEKENKSLNEISEALNIPKHNVYMIATYRRWANA